MYSALSHPAVVLTTTPFVVRLAIALLSYGRVKLRVYKPSRGGDNNVG